MLEPTDRDKFCPVIVSGALAMLMVFARGTAANMVEFSTALAVTVTNRPL